MRYCVKLTLIFVLFFSFALSAAPEKALAQTYRPDCMKLYVYIKSVLSRIDPADQDGVLNMDPELLKSPKYAYLFETDTLRDLGLTNPTNTRELCATISTSDIDGDGTANGYDMSPQGTEVGSSWVGSVPGGSESPRLRPDCQAILDRVKELMRTGHITPEDAHSAEYMNPETLMRYREEIIPVLGVSDDPNLSLATCSCRADADGDDIPDCEDEPTPPEDLPERLIMRSDCKNLYSYIKSLISDGTLAENEDLLAMNPAALTGPQFTDESLAAIGISSTTRQTCSTTLDQDSDSIPDAYDPEPVIATVPTADDVNDEIARLRARIAELEAQLEAIEDGEITPGTEVPVISTPPEIVEEGETRDAGPSMLEGGGGTGGCSLIIKK